MKKIILTVICCTMVLFVGCDYDAIDMNDLGENIIYNQCDNYDVSCRRLVEPVIVTENEFAKKYNISTDSILTDKNSEASFILEYELDQSTVQADLTKLSNGTIIVSESGSVVLVIHISEINFVEQYAINCNNIEKSSIENVDVELFNLSKESSTLLYGKFTYDKYFITCYMYNEAEDTFAEMISSFIKNNKSLVK